MSNHEDYVCTLDDKRCFFSALARYSLSFCNASEMLLGFLSLCETDHFKSQSLYICDYKDLSDSDFRKLGEMIERNAQLTTLDLKLPFVDAPCAFYESLASSIHLQVLHLRSAGCREPILSKLIAGEDGNGAVERLLRNPQSRLVELELCDIGLEYHQFMALVQLLPASKVKKIDFRGNRIHSRGLLEFIRQIPKMKSLQSISFGNDAWRNSNLSDLQECGAALVHGLTENTSITFVDSFRCFPQSELLWDFLFVNYIRQKFLMFLPESQQPIPAGLWPLILADTQLADAVYFLLQNCPAILSFCKK